MVNTPTGYADDAIAFATAQVGKPYRWGATGPDAFDCSGLIYRAYLTAGFRAIAPYRTTYQMIKFGRKVSRDHLLPGDLIFPNPGHVQLYVGGGKVCEAPERGVPVRIVPIWGFWQARRIVSPGTGADIGAAPNSGASGAGFSGGLFGGIGDALGALGWIIDPHNWLRIGEFIAGVIVLFVALKTLRS